MRISPTQHPVHAQPALQAEPAFSVIQDYSFRQSRSSDRQGNANRRAAARTGFDFDLASMRFDNAGHNRQTQTGSFGLAGVEQRSKRPIALLLRHSLARVS